MKETQEELETEKNLKEHKEAHPDLPWDNHRELAWLWDEMDTGERCKLMEGKIRDACQCLLELHNLSDAPLPVRGVAINLMTRAAWAGYCVGKGLIQEKEQE